MYINGPSPQLQGEKHFGSKGDVILCLTRPKCSQGLLVLMQKYTQDFPQAFVCSFLMSNPGYNFV